MAKGNRGGKRAGRATKTNAVKYLSADNALYESSDEVLYVQREIGGVYGVPGDDVLQAKSDGNGNITLGYATADDYYNKNSKHKYAVYDLRCGITNAGDIKNNSSNIPDAFQSKTSKYKPENEETNYGVRSVGIDWDKVNSVSGNTYVVKPLLKKKGFKWNPSGKNWVKS